MIRASVVLPALAEALYASYLDPQIHEAITGAPVTISAEPGSPFSAFGGSLSGSMIAAIPSRMIAQSWRSVNFNPGDPDSTLILSFITDGNQGRIDLVHIDVPEVDYQGVTDGWEKFYWTPWRRHLTESR
jgi:activator of HSP90 ATPase